MKAASDWAGKLRPGLLAAVATAALLAAGLWAPLELWSLQARLLWRGPRPSQVPVVLVAIDDRSLAALKTLPWERKVFAQLLRRLDQAAIIGLDVLFAESDPRNDPQLAQALAASAPTVLASARTPGGLRLLPTKVLSEASAGIGDIGIAFDSGQVLRAPLFAPDNEPALGLIVARTYASLRGLPQPALQSSLWLDWPGPSSDLMTYSFVDVLQGRVPPEKFADKIVLVGATATATDRLITPFDPQASGIHLHWAVVENLLSGRSLEPLPGWLAACIAVLFALAASVAVADRPGWLQILLVVTAAVGWALLATLGWQWQLWLPVAAPGGALLLTGGFALLESERLAARRLELQTERRRAQQAITDSLATGLVAADSEGRITFQNPASARFVATLPGERLDEKLARLGWLGDDEWPGLQQSLTEGLPDERQVRCGERTLRMRLLPLYQAGELGGVLVVIEDISAQLEVERLRQQLLSMLSHDIRLPLTNIRGYAELLRLSMPGDSDAQLQELIDPILTSSERLQGLVSDFLALTHIDSPAFEMQRQPLEAASRLRRLMAEMRLQADAACAQLVEQFEAGPLWVAADPLRFDQIFANLLSNAIKYGPPGQQITVGLRAENNQVVLRIADQGFGIDSRLIERIWEPFYRIRSDQTREIAGTGLGLAITRKLVRLHGGSIAVESTPGLGSTFTVRLPQGRPPASLEA